VAPEATRSVGLLGYGRFGQALASLCQAAGVPVKALDPKAQVPPELGVTSLQELVGGSRFVVVAVPLDRMEEAFTALAPFAGPSQVVLDVGSVKVMPTALMAKVLGARVPWVGTHPLFGPASLVRGERPLKVVITPNALHPAAVNEVEALFTRLGCAPSRLSSEAHDQEMALTHALAFFVAKGMLDVGVPAEAAHAPPSFSGIARSIESVRVDAGHLLPALHRFNPYAAQARHELLAALTSLDAALDQPAPSWAHQDPAKVTVPDLGVQSPDLRETRELIDEVDDELVALLARRAVLSHRAGRAKAALGLMVKDAGREATLLDARRRKAAELELDPDGVEEIFKAILRFSRALQG
jgi:prephenate dehydrogenase